MPKASKASASEQVEVEGYEGHLEKLEIRRAPSSAEIVPYVVAQSSHRPVGDAGNPFHEPNLRNYRLGVDLKYLLTSNLTLSATLSISVLYAQERLGLGAVALGVVPRLGLGLRGSPVLWWGGPGGPPRRA